ncbi:MAG: PAS domain-containing protein [Desulfovibrio sp.]|nr:PAS domain-containing protein [Desulfovibrio sp.]
MPRTVSPLRIKFEELFARLGMGLRAKLVILFVFIKVLPLILLALLAMTQSWRLGDDLKVRTAEISDKALEALTQTGDIAVADAVKALDNRATEEIERTSTDYALRVADFLYARDADIRLASSLPPDPAIYRRLVESLTGRLVKQDTWVLAPDGKEWIESPPPQKSRDISSSNPENANSFHYRQPEHFRYETRPLYREITFVDPDGQERIKITTSVVMDPALKDVSKRANTFVKAETYFADLQRLKPGEIYVSEVIGAYVGSRIIGDYTPEAAAKRGIPYEPEKEAYAGKENPVGRRFKGIIRWAMPVEREGKRIGYVTLALDNAHLEEFMAHTVPTDDHYTEIPDASDGNYAFIWDYKGRSIVHPRHHSIVGYDPETGDPQVPWLEDRIYDAWKASGRSYVDFISDVPTFEDQSNTRRKPAKELTREGLVGLDCRYLNFAPQCTGWFDLTSEGGSGSFLILWSGLWKITTAAAIPYYTGIYGKSRRGFGFVAIGAGVEDFHKPATLTREALNVLIKETDDTLKRLSEATYSSIAANLMQTATSLTASTAAMILLVILVAIWMASALTRNITRLIDGFVRFEHGERHFRFHDPIKDELGSLADSFDRMADGIEKSSSGLIAIIDLDFRIRYMNAELLELIGRSLDDVLGRPYQEFTIYPPDGPSDPYRAMLEGREAEPFHHKPSGRYFSGVASHLLDDDGVLVGYIVTTTDVTGILEEQERIAKQRALLDTMTSSSPDLISYVDDGMRYLAVNPRYTTLTGRNEAEHIGKTPADFFDEKNVAKIHAGFNLAVRTGKPALAEGVVAFADGHREYLDIVRTPIFDSKGRLVGVLNVGRDVTERVKVENDLRAAQAKLEIALSDAHKASESKSIFLARMSHEIRTPMNAIIGMTSIAKRKLSEASASYTEILTHIIQIEQSSTHLLGLLNDILDISKIEAGKIELSDEIFDLQALADNVVSIIKPRCNDKRITLVKEFKSIENTIFSGDSLRLRQVLINLIGNAVKFTPEFGIITFSVKGIDNDRDRTLIHFSVCDTGIGIPENAIENIFNPFEQGDGNITHKFGGTGLGLSISRSIVNLFGGELKVQSEVGIGSDFNFSIWLRQEYSTPVTSTHYKKDVMHYIGKRMLLVDDVDINRIIVIELLTDTGINIDVADDGVDAVEKFQKSPIDYYSIILMDVQMPKMNGYEASLAIRNLDRSDAKTIPIIALTANAFKEDIDMAISKGMNAHLAKPIEADKLMETLDRFIAN